MIYYIYDISVIDIDDIVYGGILTMKLEIIIPILMMLLAIFNKPIGGERNPRNWHFDNEKIDKIVTLILRTIIFMFGLLLLIYNLFII